MRSTAFLLIGTSALTFAASAAAQTTPEQATQATNAAKARTSAETAQSAGSQTPPSDQGEIIVTATKRASTVQDVPFSVNAQTQEDIQRAHAQTLEDLSRNVAGLTVQNLGPGQSQVAIRGVAAGQIVRDQPGVKEQVGIYLDESPVSLSLFTPDFDLFDLNRVETLRGPQGTLFGAGSIGGTIRYITNQPKLDVTEGELEADVNDYSGGSVGYGLKGAINVPMGSTAAARIVGYGTHFGGFIDSVGPFHKKDVNSGHRYGTRVSLLWEPMPDLKITPRVVYQDVKANGFPREEVFNLYDNQFTTQNDLGKGKRLQYLKMPEEFHDKTLLADLVASYDFGGAELTSVTSHLDRNILVSRDASALTGSVFISFAGAAPAAAGGASLISNLRDTTKLKQFSQELRLGSTGLGPFQWVFGGFYSRADRNYKQRLPTPGADVFSQDFLDVVAPGVPVSATFNGFPADSPFNSNIPYVDTQKAVFGEASYKFGQIKMTGGGRWYDFHETRDFISGGIFSNSDTRIGDKTKSNGFSPRGIVSWEPNRSLSVNLQVAKGFRLGGVNDPLNIPLCTPSDAAIFGNHPAYTDETLWNYEAGFKYSKHGFTFNAAAFHNQIRNLQVTADAGSCSSRVVFNVPKAHSDGIEAELSTHPLAGLDLSFSGSVLNSKFDSSVTTLGGDVIAGIRKGNRLPTVPKYQVAATANYQARLASNSDWYVNASVQRVGSRFTQPGDQEPGAGIFNFIFFDPVTGNFGTSTQNFGSLKLPPYTLVNASAGIRWLGGIELVAYVKNIFNVDPKLSLDRERGGRARLG
ncbi:MAG TPA: TonB-dependent receptor, partial [Sphingomicrobium sp.]